MRAWQHMQDIARELFGAYGFDMIETPAIEQVGTFVHEQTENWFRDGTFETVCPFSYKGKTELVCSPSPPPSPPTSIRLANSSKTDRRSSSRPPSASSIPPMTWRSRMTKRTSMA